MRERDLGTATLVGYMTNNCILASAADAEFVGFEIEVLSDATGAINLANAAGTADAKTVHTVLMTLLNSSWASVANTDAWIAAVAARMTAFLWSRLSWWHCVVPVRPHGRHSVGLITVASRASRAMPNSGVHCTS